MSNIEDRMMRIVDIDGVDVVSLRWPVNRVVGLDIELLSEIENKRVHRASESNSIKVTHGRDCLSDMSLMNCTTHRRYGRESTAP